MDRLPSFALALLCTTLLTACGGGDSGRVATAPATASATTETTPAAATRKPAPLIEGSTIEGEPIALGRFRGQPVMVNVWSSW